MNQRDPWKSWKFFLFRGDNAEDLVNEWIVAHEHRQLIKPNGQPLLTMFMGSDANGQPMIGILALLADEDHGT